MHDSINKYEDGQVLLINKPYRWTSFDVIRKLRQVLHIKKIGHAGTLDPLATGLLIVCTGKFTKRINEFMAQRKEYTGTITLGAVTPTFDLESEPGDFRETSGISGEQIHNAAKALTGTIAQVPPIHSAIKKDGKRVYELARAGKEVILEPRSVTVYEFDITAIENNVVCFRVICSTGTYIRSLANDLGVILGCGGYLSNLCRTAIGDFLLRDAFTPEQFEAKLAAEKVIAKTDN